MQKMSSQAISFLVKVSGLDMDRGDETEILGILI